MKHHSVNEIFLITDLAKDMHTFHFAFQVMCTLGDRGNEGERERSHYTLVTCLSFALPSDKALTHCYHHLPSDKNLTQIPCLEGKQV